MNNEFDSMTNGILQSGQDSKKIIKNYTIMMIIMFDSN